MLKKRKVLTVLERVDEHLEYHRAIDKHKSQVAFFEIVQAHIESLELENARLNDYIWNECDEDDDYEG